MLFQSNPADIGADAVRERSPFWLHMVALVAFLFGLSIQARDGATHAERRRLPDHAFMGCQQDLLTFETLQNPGQRAGWLSESLAHTRRTNEVSRSDLEAVTRPSFF